MVWLWFGRENKPKPIQDIDTNVVASLERSAEQLERQLLEIQAALQASEQVDSPSAHRTGKSLLRKRKKMKRA